MRFIIAIFCAAGVVLAGLSARAKVQNIFPKDKDAPINQVNMYFHGEVSSGTVGDLILAIRDLNVNYPTVGKINLLIDSLGGNTTSGRMAYWAVKSSKIPVRTINLSLVASAATMFYCGSRERATMEKSFFQLHPAALDFTAGWVKPDAIARSQMLLKNFNALLADTYEHCTNFSPSEISNILESEHNAKIITDATALKVGLAGKILTAIPPADASIYISDSPKNGGE